MDLESINMDAFADGQVRSKLWACHEAERMLEKVGRPAHIWLLGSWYATLAFYLLIRERAAISGFSLFDRDRRAQQIASKILRNWLRNPEYKFEFIVDDCEQADFVGYKTAQRPDLVINTSCEHFAETSWFDAIPKGTHFLLQSTDMVHDEHVRTPRSLAEFRGFFTQLPSDSKEDQIDFVYPSSRFSRYMLSGIR